MFFQRSSARLHRQISAYFRDTKPMLQNAQNGLRKNKQLTQRLQKQMLTTQITYYPDYIQKRWQSIPSFL